MAVLIDPPSWQAHGRRWSHLVSDSSLAELHAFAAGLGIPERAFEGDHYDVPEHAYPAAVARGALPVTGRELLRRLQESGLRRPKRRGEKVLRSHLDAELGQRFDTVLSALPPHGPVSRVHLVIEHTDHWLVEPDGERYRFPVARADSALTAVQAATNLRDRVLAGSPAGPEPALGPAVQLGYLRAVWHPSGRTAGVEPVLRWVVPGGDAPRLSDPAGGVQGAPARWIARARVAAGLAEWLRPLVGTGAAG